MPAQRSGPSGTQAPKRWRRRGPGGHGGCVWREPRDVRRRGELGPSLYRRMRGVAAGQQGFRVQPEDRAELGAVDAGVADEGNQCHVLLE